MDEVPVLGGESLTEGELAAVVRVVQALVDRDTAYLRQTGAYDDGCDPYLFTHHWRLWDHVDLVMPPGDLKPGFGACSGVEITLVGSRSISTCGPGRRDART
jgi:hypothetical protein